METITITHRVINGKSVYNKRFDDYEKGFYGKAISKKEYTESKQLAGEIEPFVSGNLALNIVKRITYYN